MTVIDLPTRIEADDLTLREPHGDDLPALVEACQDPELPRWTRIPTPYRIEDARDFLVRAETGCRTGRAFHLMIADSHTDTVLGSVKLDPIDPLGLTAEIGFWVAAGARGRGVATRAVGALTAWALGAGLWRIEADVLVGNDASCGVLRRVGFVEEGIRRSMPAGGCGVGDDRIDVHVFSRIRTDRA